MNPLHDIEAERCCLGSAFYGVDHADSALSSIEPQDFFLAAHQHICAELKDMIDAWEPVDLVTVSARLTKKGILEKCGGEDGLIRIMSAVPAPRAGAQYAEIVREYAWRRSKREALLSAAELCAKDATVAEIQAVIDETANSGGIVLGAASRPLSWIDVSGADTGLATGFESLDGMITTGGYPDGQLTLISAYHKSGKSALMIGSAVAIAMRGIRVGYATMADLDGPQLKRRALKMLTGWNRRPDHAMYAEHWDSALGDLNACDVEIYDATSDEAGADVETVSAWARSTHSLKPFAALFCDYAQEMTTSDPKATSMVAEQEIVSRKLVRLARRLHIPIVVGSQITEGSEKQGTRDKTKYSRAWEERAGWVLRLKIDGSDANIETAFSRFGPPGSVKMSWDSARVRFAE